MPLRPSPVRSGPVRLTQPPERNPSMPLSRKEIDMIASEVINRIAELGEELDQESEADADGGITREDIPKLTQYAMANKITDGTKAIERYLADKSRGLIR